MAFYVGLNVEHYQVDRPSTSIFAGTAELTPDPLNYGWRDYGPRVGIWRLIESLDRHGMRASVMINSDVCARYPEIIEAVESGTGHGSLTDVTTRRSRRTCLASRSTPISRT